MWSPTVREENVVVTVDRSTKGWERGVYVTEDREMDRCLLLGPVRRRLSVNGLPSSVVSGTTEDREVSHRFLLSFTRGRSSKDLEVDHRF